jgi:hypothetical protein
MKTRGLIGAAWASFALILLFLGGQFLFACGFGLWNACPARVDATPLVQEVEKADMLQRQIHLAELDVARKPVCAPPKPKADFIELRKTTYARGAKPGKLEVFLEWRTLDDVDLESFCPGGRLGGSGSAFGPGICGDGKLDLDANRNLTTNIQRDAVEHIAWQDPPTGEYRFAVHLYLAKDANRAKTIPFTMTMSLDGETKTCTGTLEWIPRSQGVKAANGGILATRIASLRWKTGDPLPNCDWEWQDATFCDQSNTCLTK